jgi:hypothetical protein
MLRLPLSRRGGSNGKLTNISNFCHRVGKGASGQVDPLFFFFKNLHVDFAFLRHTLPIVLYGPYSLIN